MSTLKSYELKIFDEIFEMESGYVLNFSNETFNLFFRENGIEITEEKYKDKGSSKAKRLKSFIEKEDDKTVGNILNELINYSKRLKKIDEDKEKIAKDYINKILRIDASENKTTEDDDFFKREIIEMNFDYISNSDLKGILNDRVKEIGLSLKNELPLACIFLCGSVLEGILLELAQNNIELFNKSDSSPKDRDGRVKRFDEWTLENLINVSYSLSFISLDIKNHSHALKNFRNYIHPRQQLREEFSPTPRTAEIGYRVLRGAVEDINRKIKIIKSI